MWARRIDANQGSVVSYLRALGWSVFITSPLGRGFPDLVVGCPGFAAVVEVKDGDKVPSKRQLTPDEKTFREMWQGPYVIAESPEDAARQLDVLRGT
jgi:hypothetical protein